MTEVLDFPAFCRRVTKNFIRTAVLIDDEAFVDRELAEMEAELVEPAFLDTSASTVGGEKQPKAERGSSEPPERTSDVDLKPLADAFLDRRIICAVLKPGENDDDDLIVKRAVTACANADVVILDWYLRKGNSQLSQRALSDLLQEDSRQNGRMRLVVIYTSAAPLEERRSELEEHLQGAGLTVDGLDAARPTMKVGSTRIVFVEKSFSGAGTQVGDLPELAISELANEADGLMPTFAMSAVAAIRDGTHHLLSLFRSQLDPALLGHRMVLEEPLDTNEFLLSVLLLQVRGLLTRDAKLEQVLSPSIISAWFDLHANGGLGEFLKAKSIAEDKARASLMEGEAKAKIGKDNVSLLHRALFKVEGEDDNLEQERASELARLSSHAREANGFSPSPPGWTPHLTIGSVVRREAFGGDEALFLLCTQPLCDTVRLQKDTFFSFTALTKTSGSSRDFWLVVKDGQEQVRLRVDDLTKASTRYFAAFKPADAAQKIIASYNEALGQFIFEDVNGRKYIWVADLDQLKAQRAASEMASVLGRVGLDEYEWLRQGGKVKG